jgi:hypothetical protein
MGSVLRFARISVLAAVASSLALPPAAAAQDASGRPTGGGQDDSGRPPKSRRPRGKPKKVIRTRADNDRDPAVLTSSVIIRSYPPGAEVFVDGAAVGTTGDDGELELSEVKLGTHRIVLRKDGYREWAQTVVLKSTTETPEFEPLLQSENSQFMRDVAKLPAIEFGKEVTGRITRDSIGAKDGKTFYNEYVITIEDPDAYVVVLKGRGVAPSLKLVDDKNVPYAIQRLSEEIYQTGVVPHPGYYFLQVQAALDESTFTSGDYSIKVLEESEAHGARPIAVGAPADGALDATDLQSSPGDFFDQWSLAGQPGARVTISVNTKGGFTPALTLLLDGKVVATSGAVKEKKKKNEAPVDTTQIVTTLTGGTYTIYVRSVAGPKQGGYQLSVTAGG